MTHPWELIHRTRKWGTYPAEYVVRQVIAFFRTAAPRTAAYRPTALDIGCGAGAHSCMMESEGFDVTAIDVSPTAIQRLLARNVFSGTAMIHDITSGHAPMNYGVAQGFDFILDNLSLSHVQNPPLERILSWLNPGGWFIGAVFTVPPEGVLPTWPYSIGEVIEEHAITRMGKQHVIQVMKYVKP